MCSSDLGKVYAPTAGKVLKLYPMGNRIRFRTDSGLELLLNICRDREELHSAYYHCNVLQNEIVRKGKLLMEFDQEGLAREGVDTAVTVEMCQIPERGQIVGTWKDYIRAGEELLWIQRKGRDQEDSFSEQRVSYLAMQVSGCTLILYQASLRSDRKSVV